jgi:hypothetical protein
MTGGGGGIDVSTGFGFVTGDPRVNVIRSTISNHGTAIRASAYTKTASVTLSGSMVTGNVNGFELSGNGSLMSRGNNTITDNGSNTGTLTPLAPI